MDVPSVGEGQKRSVLGILGGMGPLASAEFLRTIYEFSLRGREQQSPVVMMYSDPTFPDRTEAFLAGKSDVVLKQLTDSLRRLTQLGATSIVVCCMTIHHLLPQLPADLRATIISLLDVCFANLAQTRKAHLLICSTGTRSLRLFENHSQWELLKQHIVLPDEADQYKIHRDLIYPIKNNADLRELTPLLESLLVKYRLDSFIAGCSEIHLLAKHYNGSRGPHKYGCVDPLTVIAKELAEECI
jgi:aspartate racemase